MRTLALVALGIVLIGLLLYLATRHKDDAPDENSGMHRRRIGDGLRELQALQNTYAVMTPELLAQTPDDRLLQAVLANLWAKMSPGLENADEIMRGQSEARQNVYAVYAVTGGLQQDGARQTLQTAAPWLSRCEDMLRALDMAETAALLQSVRLGDEQAALGYQESFAALDGKGRLAAYIREHAEAFCDGQT